jgi:transcriptional regulator with XRE-family HTH domain
LATAVGVTPQFISRIEAGIRAPSFRVLESLASKLSVKPEELLRFGSPASSKKVAPDSLDFVQLQGAARRLVPDDLRLVLDLARRLGRRA